MRWLSGMVCLIVLAGTLAGCFGLPGWKGPIVVPSDTPIVGAPVASHDQARRWLSSELAKRGSSSDWLELVDLYYQIGPKYNIRPDVALAQAVHETGFFRFDNLVKPWQNNFAGIGATGTPSDGNTPLNGADPARVRFESGVHGAIFVDRATGVEAQVQHLYAYATTAPLPTGAVLLSPRFTYVRRGSAPTVEELSGKWAGDTEYHVKILSYLRQMIATP